MKKLFKKNSFGESIEAYAARAYCSCSCVGCDCTSCMDAAHDETVFQVMGNNSASNYDGIFDYNNKG